MLDWRHVSVLATFISRRMTTATSPMSQIVHGTNRARRGRGALTTATQSQSTQSHVSTRQSSRQATAAAAATAENGSKDDDQCVICMDEISQPKKLGCGHTFCTDCIAEYFRRCQEKCPTCGKVFGVLRGNQPAGRFNKSVIPTSLPGYERCKTIEITYTIPNGIQTVSFSSDLILQFIVMYSDGSP